MSSSQRPPGSREEDAWLSDEQLGRCAPAEAEPFQSPVPTRMISNGEYMPHPQTRQQQHVEYRIKELADAAAKKLGVSRRQFLEGTGGLAASFIAINEAFGKPFFKVSPVEMYEPAAFAEHGTPSDVFVFDDQTHIVRSSTNTPQGLRALAQGPGSVSTGAGFTANPDNGAGGNPAGVDELGSPWTDWNPAQLGPDSPPNPARRPQPSASSIWGSTSTGCTSKPRPASQSSATRTSPCSRRPAEARPGRRPTSPIAWSARF
jgi:hypothetical protein